MDKLKMHSPDWVNENIARLAALFPNCVTESRDDKGNLKKSIDFDLLRQELSTQIVEGPQERYHLDWPGKREALLTANAPIAKTLRPCREESVDFDTTQNLFIEGDNLDALKLLQETYLGKVKMIYIDPPYNTGNDFVYKDNFAAGKDEYLEESGQKDAEGGKLIANTNSNGRFHSDWLSMIFPRLKLSRNLLRDDGIIFISIGENEFANLERVCNEVFGEENQVTICSRVMKTGGQKGMYFSPCVDYILVYAKNICQLAPIRAPISQNVIDKVYTKIQTTGDRAGQKYRSMGLYQAGLDKRANQRYYIECPDGSLAIPPGNTFPEEHKDGSQIKPSDGDGVWRWTYSTFHEQKSRGNVEFIESDRTSLLDQNGQRSKYNIYYKIWLTDRLEEGQLPGNIIDKFENRHSSSELKSLNIPFDYAKPFNLIKYDQRQSFLPSGDN